MQGGSGGIAVGVGIAVIDGSSITIRLEGVLIEAEDLHVRKILRQCGAEILADELRFSVRRKIHALPRAVVAHRFVLGRYSPKLDTCVAVRLEVLGKVACECIIILRQQCSATAVVVVVEEVVVLHPCRCSPRRTEKTPSGIGLRGFDVSHLADELIHIETLVFDLRINGFVPAVLMYGEREILQRIVAGYVIVGIMPFQGKIA